jgi:hypothetical protein
MWRNNYSPGAKPINVNSGSGSTLARKVGAKYSKRLNNSNGNFSLNGSSNQSYIGNPNSNLSYNGCKDTDTSIKISVKNYSGLRGTRITNSSINDGFKCNPVNSYQCYTALNAVLITDFSLNKHHLYDTPQSQYLDIKKSKCNVDRSNYLIDILNNIGTNNCSFGKIRTNSLTNNCNITKDINQIFGYTSNYDLYINEKVKTGCSYNPKDAKVIAC